MRLVDIGLAIPVVFLFIFMAQVYKPSLALLIVLPTFVSRLIPARLVRGETLSLRTREYVQAVEMMGGRSWRIILRHVIPNTVGVMMVTVTFQIANAILTLAVLQHLGFGLPPTTPTWGSMLSAGATHLQDGPSRSAARSALRCSRRSTPPPSPATSQPSARPGARLRRAGPRRRDGVLVGRRDLWPGLPTRAGDPAQPMRGPHGDDHNRSGPARDRQLPPRRDGGGSGRHRRTGLPRAGFDAVGRHRPGTWICTRCRCGIVHLPQGFPSPSRPRPSSR